jgi:hypothetical protein
MKACTKCKSHIHLDPSPLTVLQKTAVSSMANTPKLTPTVQINKSQQ